MLVLAAQLARGRSLSDLLGAYSVVGDGRYDARTVARFFLYHLAELDLYLGVLPVRGVRAARGDSPTLGRAVARRHSSPLASR